MHSTEPTVMAPAADNEPGAPRPSLRFPEVAVRYLSDLSHLLADLDLAGLERLTDRLRTARDSGATVFIAGNGGSAATATHWANDLNKAASRSGRRPFRCLSLTDGTSWLTALANDEGYEQVFAGQLVNLGSPGDVLLIISASGRSPNLVAAVDAAAERDMTSLALLGFDGGILRERADDHVLVRTPLGAYGLVESAHAVAADIITTFLIDDRATPA